jgi:hypothetical protein
VTAYGDYTIMKNQKWCWKYFRIKEIDERIFLYYDKNMALPSLKKSSLKYNLSFLFTNKIFLFCVAFTFSFLIYNYAKAEIVYSRDPSGVEVTSPLNINVSFTEDSETGLNQCESGEGHVREWSVKACSDLFSCGNDNLETAEFVSDSVNSHTFTLPLNYSNYNLLMGVCSFTYPPEEEENWGCSGKCYQIGEPLEGAQSSIIFSVVSSIIGGIFPPPGTLIASVATSVGTTLSSLWVIIGSIAGMALAFGLVKAFVEYFKIATELKKQREEIYAEAKKQHDILYKYIDRNK